MLISPSPIINIQIENNNLGDGARLQPLSAQML